MHALLSPALSIALLAGIESLLSAVVADGMIGGRHRTDMELVAQGVANVASPLFGGIPATGAIARTATNVKSGGRTPVSGMIHALTLLVILVFAGDWATLIPMPALAGILMVVAYNMSERHLFVKIFRSTRSDIAVLLTTFSLTLLADLTVAIQVGVVLASLLFMMRMSETMQAGYITGPSEEDGTEGEETRGLFAGKLPEGVEVFEINGPFFFGAADRFKDALREIARKPKVLILRMRHVPVMDSTGLRALEDVVDKTMREGTIVILSGLQSQPRDLLDRSGLLERIGKGNEAPDIQRAIDIARKALEEQQRTEATRT
jgi:SulP family sulfate permease